jgi:biopolymer transport protein ExbD
MNGYNVVRRSELISAEIAELLNSLVRLVIERAASRTPTIVSERLREEWMADLSTRVGCVARLRFAFGCFWAAMRIEDEDCPEHAAASCSPIHDRIVMAGARRGIPLFSGHAGSAASVPAMCDINTTPLIDILLVLLVTLIVSLPIMTHAVKLDMPQSRPPQGALPPEVINLDIDFDGTVVWNGSPVANLEQLEGYFSAARSSPTQPPEERRLRQ